MLVVSRTASIRYNGVAAWQNGSNAVSEQPTLNIPNEGKEHMTMGRFVIVIGWILMVLLGVLVGENRGRRVEGMLLTLLFGPPGLIIVARRISGPNLVLTSIFHASGVARRYGCGSSARVDSVIGV